MKNKTTLILLASIVLLGGYIWLQEAWRARMPSKEYRRVKLFHLEAEQLVSIQFRYTNDVVFCIKEGGGWMAGASEHDLGRADEALVQRMVAGLNAMGKGTTITTQNLETRGLKAAEYGFDQPALDIVAVDSKGRHRWQVGRHTPLGNMVYVRENDEGDIYTVSDKILEIAPTRPDQLRDRTLFAADSPGVRRIEIRGQGGFVQILKDLQTGWQIQQPVSAPADAGVVERYIDRLFLLRIEEFIEENVSDFSAFGLQREQQISLGGVDGTSRMLILGDEITDRPGFIYARRADDTSVFSLKSDVLEFLNVTADQFRNVAVLSLQPDQVSGISIARGDDLLEIRRKEDGQWMIERPVVWPAENKAVAELLKLWDAGVITDFDVPASTAPVEWTFVFGARELAQSNTISVLAASGKKDGLLFRRGTDPSLYQMNLPFVPESMVDPLNYKNREIWTFDQQMIEKVVIRRNGTAVRTIERQADGSYITNGQVPENPAALNRILGTLASIRTSGYVAHNPRDLEIYGLASPALEIQLSLAGNNELGRVLLIGRETNQGFYTKVKGRDVVFYLGKRIVDALAEEPAAPPSAAPSEAE